MEILAQINKSQITVRVEKETIEKQDDRQYFLLFDKSSSTQQTNSSTKTKDKLQGGFFVFWKVQKILKSTIEKLLCYIVHTAFLKRGSGQYSSLSKMPQLCEQQEKVNNRRSSCAKFCRFCRFSKYYVKGLFRKSLLTLIWVGFLGVFRAPFCGVGGGGGKIHPRLSKTRT